MVSRLLKQLGYSLQAKSKRLKGAHLPDRNAQFEGVNETLRLQLEANEPAISVDTKKMELVGASSASSSASASSSSSASSSASSTAAHS